MRRIGLLLIALLPLVGCSDAAPRTTKSGEAYQSYVPPESAEIGEAFKPDENSEITVRDIEKDGAYILVEYTWKNLGSAKTAHKAFSLNARQDGVKLVANLKPVDDVKPLVTQIENGESIDIQQAFEQNGDADVTLSFLGKETAIFIDGYPVNPKAVTVSERGNE